MTRLAPFLAIAAVVLLAGCTVDSDQAATPSATADAATHAHAVLASSSGSHVQGRLSFVGTDQGVHVTGRISGLQPGSTHGFHIHQNGDCSAPDATSAGGHFNPAQQPHGDAGKGPHHAGDIPNQQADASGVATVDVVVRGVQLGTGSDTDVLGRAVIVHAKPDDYTSQPSGNAGARIACGVITRDYKNGDGGN
jgi:Cu-Zn family superoxide dismutase